MQRRTRIAIAGAAAAGVITAGSGIAAAAGEDSETPITGDAYTKAAAAALAHTGQGRVTETEVGDEDAFYEVEVTMDNGSQVDVHLNEGFDVVSTENDDDGPDRDD